MAARTPKSPWTVALQLLARREQTPQELAAALTRRGFDQSAIAEVIARAEALGLLSEARAAQLTAARLAARHGDRAIAQRLAARGIAPETIAATLAETVAAQGDERSRALAVWRKKFAAPPADRRQWQQQARFLAARGFSWETIHAILDRPDRTPPSDLPWDLSECS